MNQADRKEFDLIHNKIDNIHKTLNEMKINNEASHMKNRTDMKFIKDNMFDPHAGLWAENKLNSQFRKDTSKWRGVIGAGFVGLFMKHIWDMFQ